VDFLCRTTELSIILVKKGTPRFPACPWTIWMANDSTVPEAFNLFAHAVAIVVGTSSFVRLVAQGTHARRLVVPERAVGYYLGATGARWTVVGDDGNLHHFSSTEDVIRTLSQPGSFHRQSYRIPRENKPPILEVCGRSWRELL